MYALLLSLFYIIYLFVFCA